MKTTKTKALAIVSAVVTAIAAVSDFTHFLPGDYGPLITVVFASLTAILVAVGDYLDDGRVNGSFLPGRKLPEDQPKHDTTHE